MNHRQYTLSGVDMLSFKRIGLGDVNWNTVHTLGQVNIFHTGAWIDFIVRTQHIEPVIVEIRKTEQIEGYFTGFIDKKFGLKILGSPFRGWNTYFMGFNLKPGISRKDVLRDFPSYAFKQLGCQYLEIIDPEITSGEWESCGYKVEQLPWFSVDLQYTEDELFARLKSTCRTAIRKAQKSGVIVEEATDLNFANDYYEQYKDVLAKRGFVPAYGIDIVKFLIEYLLPTGNLLLLRARNSEGICIATQIFTSFNRTGVYWGGASWREYQSLRPSDLLMWSGMKRLKERGILTMHMGANVEDFKKKFGATDAQIFRLKKASNIFLDWVLGYATSPQDMKFRNIMLRLLSSSKKEETDQ